MQFFHNLVFNFYAACTTPVRHSIVRAPDAEDESEKEEEEEEDKGAKEYSEPEIGLELQLVACHISNYYVIINFIFTFSISNVNPDETATLSIADWAEHFTSSCICNHVHSELS